MSAESSADKPADRPAGTSADEKNASPVSFVLSGTKDATLASLASSAGSTAGMSAVTNPLPAVMPTDASADGRWLTYDELAELRGIDRASARRLTTRLKWPRRPGNDGTVRILVPLRHLRPPRRSADRPAGIAPFEAALAALREAHASETATLRDTVEGLRGTIARAEHRAQYAEAKATEAEVKTQAARAGEAEDAAEALRTSIGELRAGQALM